MFLDKRIGWIRSNPTVFDHEDQVAFLKLLSFIERKFHGKGTIEAITFADTPKGFSWHCLLLKNCSKIITLTKYHKTNIVSIAVAHLSLRWNTLEEMVMTWKAVWGQYVYYSVGD